METITTHSSISLSPAGTRFGSRTVARYLAYPAVLAANAALVTWGIVHGASLESVASLGLVGTIAVLFLLEWVMPYERAWHPSFKEALRDFFYFGLNGAMDAVVKLGVAFAVAAFGAWDNALPFAVALPIAILVADFGGYWLHRWGHHGWLWKVHGVHHTPDKVNTWNNNTIHFVNSIYSGLAKTLPLALLGFDPTVIVIAAYVGTIQSYAVHANIDVELGWLGYLIMSPAHHRLHHSTVMAEAGNFASATTLSDILFGTFVYEPGKAPEEVGVVEPESFPSPLDVLRNQLHPFIDQGQK
jgi:sterol desaturase/sphingolipid hydroxylase (fatty acid hydroxylase superfamily)